MIQINAVTCKLRNPEGKAIILCRHFWRIEDGNGNVKLIPISKEDREIMCGLLLEIEEELSKDGRTCKTMSFQHTGAGVYASLDKDGNLFMNIQEEIRATFHK